MKRTKSDKIPSPIVMKQSLVAHLAMAAIRAGAGNCFLLYKLTHAAYLVHFLSVAEGMRVALASSGTPNSSSRGLPEIAVSSGLAVTVVAKNMVLPGWRVLSEEDGLPRRPKADLVLLKGHTEFPAAVECLYQYLKAAVCDTDRLTSERDESLIASQ